MMTKENQSVSYQDQLLVVEKKLKKVISDVTRLETYLNHCVTLYATDEKLDAKSYLLYREMVRAEESVHICGLLFQMFFVNLKTPQFYPTSDFVADGDSDFTFEEEVL